MALGWAGGAGANVRLLNKGDLALGNLFVANQNFNLTGTDQVVAFYLSNGGTSLGAGVAVTELQLRDGATAANSAAGNIRSDVIVDSGSTLILGADLNVSRSVAILGVNSTLDAQGHNITANYLSLGYSPENPGDPNIQLLNDGAITVNRLMSLAGGAQLELRGGNDSAQSLILSEDSTLRIKSAATGLTITGTAADDLGFSDSTLTLELDGRQPGWVLRWANPAGGDHIADLNALIAENRIVFDVTNGGLFNIVSQNGYTYIVQPVPEPGLMFLFAAPVAVGFYRLRRGLYRPVRHRDIQPGRNGEEDHDRNHR